MRRMLFHVAAALSLLLCVATLVLWVRSDRHNDYAGAGYFHRHVVMQTCPNGIWIASWPDPNWMSEPGLQTASYEYDVKNAFGAWISRRTDAGSWLGFDWKPLQFSNESAPKPGAFEFRLPSWFLLLVFLTLPAFVLYTWWRAKRRQRHGLCATCGYDIRATPHRCPECGARPQPLAEAGA